MRVGLVRARIKPSIKIPSDETLRAIEDADSDDGATYKTPDALFKHLGI